MGLGAAGVSMNSKSSETSDPELGIVAIGKSCYKNQWPTGKLGWNSSKETFGG